MRVQLKVWMLALMVRVCVLVDVTGCVVIDRFRIFVMCLNMIVVDLIHYILALHWFVFTLLAR